MVASFFSFFKTDSACLIILSVSLGIGFSEGLSFEDSTLNNKSPLETLSPTLIFTDSTLPVTVDGISTLDLSLSIVTIGSFKFILSPTFTKSSITSTFSNSPISGTSNFSLII